MRKLLKLIVIPLALALSVGYGVALYEVAVPRLQQLAKIATTYGRPWTEFYPNLAEQMNEGWHRSYGEI